jgi:hypothetical protein
VTLVVLLLILVALWIVVLAPGFFKRHFERRSTVSIESFHEQLHLLERTGPKLVSPAYRLESVPSEGAPPPNSSSGLPSISSMPGRPNLVLLRPVDVDGDGDLIDDGHGGHFERIGTPVSDAELYEERRAQRVERRRRHEQAARQRRRDLVLGLTATLVTTGLLGIIHPLHFLWIITAITGVALVGYVGLVAYAQSMPANHRPDTQTKAHVSSPASAGLPGAWDDAIWGGSEGYEEPRRVAAR